MLEASRQQLVLDLDRGEARRLGQRDGAMQMHRIAEAAAGIEHDRQVAGRMHVDRNLRQFGNGDVGFGDAFVPAERATAEIDRLETRRRDKPRHDRVERHRRDDQVAAGNEFTQCRHVGFLCCSVMRTMLPHDCHMKSPPMEAGARDGRLR